MVARPATLPFGTMLLARMAKPPPGVGALGSAMGSRLAAAAGHAAAPAARTRATTAFARRITAITSTFTSTCAASAPATAGRGFGQLLARAQSQLHGVWPVRAWARLPQQQQQTFITRPRGTSRGGLELGLGQVRRGLAQRQRGQRKPKRNSATAGQKKNLLAQQLGRGNGNYLNPHGGGGGGLAPKSVVYGIMACNTAVFLAWTYASRNHDHALFNFLGNNFLLTAYVLARCLPLKTEMPKVDGVVWWSSIFLPAHTR